MGPSLKHTFGEGSSDTTHQLNTKTRQINVGHAITSWVRTAVRLVTQVLTLYVSASHTIFAINAARGSREQGLGSIFKQAGWQSLFNLHRLADVFVHANHTLRQKQSSSLLSQIMRAFHFFMTVYHLAKYGSFWPSSLHRFCFSLDVADGVGHGVSGAMMLRPQGLLQGMVFVSVLRWLAKACARSAGA